MEEWDIEWFWSPVKFGAILLSNQPQMEMWIKKGQQTTAILITDEPLRASEWQNSSYFRF